MPDQDSPTATLNPSAVVAAPADRTTPPTAATPPPTGGTTALSSSYTPTAVASEPLSDGVIDLLKEWYGIATKASDGHSSACDDNEKWDSVFGLVSTVLAAIIGSTIFITLQRSTSTGVRVAAGIVAIAAAVASGIQTTAKYGARAERYRQASRRYSAAARQIDELLALPPAPADLKPALDTIRKTLDDTGSLAPNVPPKIWKGAKPQPVSFRSHVPVLEADAQA